jgi:hypothetical protein
MRKLITQIIFLILFVQVLYCQDDLQGLRFDFSGTGWDECQE